MTSRLMVALMITSLTFMVADVEPEDAIQDDPLAISCEVGAISDYSAPGVIISVPAEPILIEQEEEPEVQEWTGPKLTQSTGRIQGPEAEETWYNLQMGKCIDIMRDLGYSVEEYPFWIRSDGCKMLGEYIMVGANTYSIPKGTIVNTSLGKGIVADHCVAAQSKNLYDIAVTW